MQGPVAERTIRQGGRVPLRSVEWPWVDSQGDSKAWFLYHGDGFPPLVSLAEELRAQMRTEHGCHPDARPGTGPRALCLDSWSMSLSGNRHVVLRNLLRGDL